MTHHLDWEVTTKHVHFDWDINWEKRLISGSATHTLVTKMESPTNVMYVIRALQAYGRCLTIFSSFDTQYLDIYSVQVNGSDAPVSRTL